MIKNLTGGSVINYGPALPADATSFDGTLFYKTAGADQGLYIFGYNQDSNPAVVGDQSTQAWSQVQNPGLYVSKNGDVVNGPLGVIGVGTTNDPYGRISVTMAADTNNYGYYGMTRQGQVGWSMGVDTNNRFFIGTAGSGTASNVTSRPLTMDVSGNMQLNGNTVWHAGNDGLNSGLDAGLLGGQPPTFYTNAGNITTGTLDVARLPFTPVQQGGAPGMVGSKIYIGWNASNQLALQVDSTNFSNNWPINVSGSAATANFANSATNATLATDSTSTRYVRQNGSASGIAMTFNWQGQSGTPTWLWGGNDGINNYVYSPTTLTVGNAVNATNATNAVNATNATNLAGFTIGGRSTADFNSYTTNGHYAGQSQPGNSPGPYGSLIVASNSDVGLQITGGYNTDSLYFRGWYNSASAFTPWRAIYHTGNLSLVSNNYNGGSVAQRDGNGDIIAHSFRTAGGGRFIGEFGAVGAPTFGFANDGDTGMYSEGDGTLCFAVNNQRAAKFISNDFYVAGNFVAGGNVTAYSDRRIKKNIAPIENALEKVKALNGVTYNRIDNDEAGTGLIAQDVQAVLPQAVQEQVFDGLLSVAYGNLVGLLVESIKELNKKVDDMAAELKVLKGQ